jgi:hypothetical protein
MTQNKEVKNEDAWTPYRELLRYKRLLMASMALNLILAAALIRYLR